MLLGHSRHYAKLLGASYRTNNNKHDLTPTDRATTSSSSDPFADPVADPSTNNGSNSSASTSNNNSN